MVQEQAIAWFIIRDGQQHGPIAEQEMQAMIARGLLKTTDMVWRDGFPDWQPCHQAFRLAQHAPPPMPQPPPFKGATAQPSHENQATQVCPHCRTTIPLKATVCSGCGAKKCFTNGFTHNLFPLFMSLVGSALGTAALLFFVAFVAPPARHEADEIFPLFFTGAAIVLGLYCAWTAISLARGRRWIR
jgi:hypothetical protein